MFSHVSLYEQLRIVLNTLKTDEALEAEDDR